MADTKISALTAATTPLAGTEVLPLVQSGTTKKVSVANLTAGRAVSAQSQTVTQFFKIDDVVADQVGTYGVAYGTSGVGLSVAAYQIRFLVNSYAPSSTGYAALTLDTAANATLNAGNLIQGTAGKGVNFTANTPAAGMTSQLLNWYEEGTWTPTDASGAGLTLTVTYAKYVRVGKQVTVNAFFSYPSTASGANAVVGGLPFTVEANNYPPGLLITNSTVTAGALFNAAATTFGIVDPAAYGIARTNLQMSAVNVLLSATYFV